MTDQQVNRERWKIKGKERRKAERRKIREVGETCILQIGVCQCGVPACQPFRKSLSGWRPSAVYFWHWLLMWNSESKYFNGIREKVTGWWDSGSALILSAILIIYFSCIDPRGMDGWSKPNPIFKPTIWNYFPHIIDKRIIKLFRPQKTKLFKRHQTKKKRKIKERVYFLRKKEIYGSGIFL